MTLSIDTNRQRPPRLPRDLPTPTTSSTTNTTLLWSATATTPSSALTHTTTYDFAADATSEWLISKIDEYLADLHAVPLTNPPRASLTIALDPSSLQVEPSSPSSTESTDHRLGRHRCASLPSSPVECETDFSSPLFHRCFAGLETKMRDDAAPFPYSPREEGCWEVGEREREVWRRTRVMTEESRGLPSIRLESVGEADGVDREEEVEGGVELVCADRNEERGEMSSRSLDVPRSPTVGKARMVSATTPTTPAKMATSLQSPTTTLKTSAALHSSVTPPKSASSLHVPTPPTSALSPPPAIPPRRIYALSRSASAGNLTRPSPSPASSTAFRNDAGLSPIRRSTDTDVKTGSSPTSTQIVSGVRKVNKLKKLLGEEVGSHISPTPTAGSMKPLPRLPLHRSATTLPSPVRAGQKHKRGCPSAGAGKEGRPGSARDGRCECSASQAGLISALTGTGLRMSPTRARKVGERPSTSASVGSAKREGSFFEV